MRYSPMRRVIAAASITALSPVVAGAQRVRPVSESLRAADSAWTVQRFDAARAGYAEVVRSDSTNGRAVFRLATLLSWENELNRAVELFRQYRRLEPSDDDGRVALARVLAWRGDYVESMSIYDSVLARTPGHRDAALGAAQALAWSGELERAVGRYEQWVATHPDDADAWTGLARARQWSGRVQDARDALRRAVAARPDHREAVTQLEAVEASLAPSLEPTIAASSDSDHSRSTMYALEGGLPTPWGSRIVGGPSYRVADLAGARGTALALKAGTTWALAGGNWILRSEVGVTRLSGKEAPGSTRVGHTEPLLSARLSGRPVRRMTFGLGAARAPFDETARLIIAGIATTTLEGDIDWSMTPRLSLGAAGGTMRVTGGAATNRRDAISSAVRWTVSRAVSAAVGVRTFGYAESASDGYFAPKRYTLAEGSVRATLGAEPGWGINVDVGLGHQGITAFDGSRAGRFAQRATGSVSYRPAPGMEWSLGGGFANVASPTTIGAADYRAWTVSLRGRVRP